MTHGFFSKKEDQHFDIFNDDGIWFVERTTDHLWLTKDNEWTNDPLKAIQFKNKINALAAIIVRKLSECEPTQHEF